MDFPIFTAFDKRVLNALLDTADAGVDLIGRNGERRALDEALAPAKVDQTKLFEVQVKLGLVTHKARIQLGIGGGAIPYAEAMALTLEKAAELKAAGLLNEDAPPPEPAQSTREIMTARADALGV